VRTWLSLHGKSTSRALHRASVSFVSAGAQAKALQIILPLLTQEEREIYRRGRNANVGAIPQSASAEEYHTATGLEALFGSLYLQGKTERIQELFALIMGD
jgi:ribonuclease-3 family protein